MLQRADSRIALAQCDAFVLRGLDEFLADRVEQAGVCLVGRRSLLYCGVHHRPLEALALEHPCRLPPFDGLGEQPFATGLTPFCASASGSSDDGAGHAERTFHHIDPPVLGKATFDLILDDLAVEPSESVMCEGGDCVPFFGSADIGRGGELAATHIGFIYCDGGFVSPIRLLIQVCFSKI